MTSTGLLFQNRLLTSLCAGDLALLRPLLHPVDLPLETVLEKPNERIEEVYFLGTGMASVVSARGPRIEVGLIGRQGMTGLSVVMGDDRSVNSTYMQGAGSGFRIDAKAFARALQRSETLRLSLLHYVQAFSTQVAQTAIANSQAKIEARLGTLALDGAGPVRAPCVSDHADAGRAAARSHGRAPHPRKVTG
jgi:CRP-like cAMP-binding protein